MADAYVQIAPDSTGKRVRTVELALLQADGSTVTVEVQAVAITDDAGNLLDSSAWQQEALVELRRLNRAVRELTAVCIAGLHPKTARPTDIFLNDGDGT